jgi:hypothetical protein
MEPGHNASHILLTFIDVSNETVLDGFVIEKSSAKSAYEQQMNVGGAIYIRTAVP